MGRATVWSSLVRTRGARGEGTREATAVPYTRMVPYTAIHNGRLRPLLLQTPAHRQPNGTYW